MKVRERRRWDRETRFERIEGGKRRGLEQTEGGRDGRGGRERDGRGGGGGWGVDGAVKKMAGGMGVGRWKKKGVLNRTEW